MQLRLAAIGCLAIATLSSVPAAPTASVQTMQLNGAARGPRFDGIGVVNGGGATSVLLKDYPEPQRSQILDLVYKPKFGASVSALLVEIPGDGNSTQGSMPSHMHTRDDLDYTRGYTWWILREAKKRNPDLSLDGAAWSAPGWVGNGNFWSQDAADYYVKWLQGLRSVYGLEFDALGCRNEAGVSLDFAKQLRTNLDANGFNQVKIHAFDNWWKDKFDFVKNLADDEKARDAISILAAHTLAENPPSAEVRELAAKMGKPIWNTEEHVYLKGFDCAISVVKAFNENHIRSGATRIVNWYDIAGVYPMEPYSEDPAALLAWSPWSGNYQVREALWGYAHYGQFTKIGWHYLESGCGPLDGGGTVVTFNSPTGDGYSIILETKGAKASQQVRFQIGGGLPAKPLCVWRSDEKAQFVQQPGITPDGKAFTITLEPNTIYSLSTTTGQQKGSFANIPAAKPFPFPYHETFEEYTAPKAWGWLPRYTADIYGAFEISDRPDGKGKCMRQAMPVRAISWGPDWLPYTILGDDQWKDYEVGVDVCLNAGDSAGVMGRINHVGTGYGVTPKGYFLQLSADGECRLVVIRGKVDKNKLTGDAEQQALIKAGKDEGEGGEKVLGTVRVPGIAPGQWHNIKLRFDGSSITALVDDKPVLSVTDNLYSRGMAGLLAGAGEQRKLSTPWFDNLLIKAVNAPTPKPTALTPGQSPIYGAAASTVIDATKASVIGDGVTLNTARIQKVIDDCAAGGGGTIHFPAGRYLTGTIQIKSNITLRLAKDATLLGSTDIADYRNLDPFLDGLGDPMGYALVVAVDAEQVGIEGEGTIDGQGRELRARQSPYKKRPFLVRWVRCTGVKVRNVHLTHPGAWTLNFFQSKGILVEGATIRSRNSGVNNADGIDLDSCQDARITGCDIESGDDAFCLKSTSLVPTRNITATNLTLSTWCNAIKLGTESIGGFENISVSNCRVINTGMAGIALYTVDGGDLRTVTISDITMDSVGTPVSIRRGARFKTFRDGDRPKTTPGKLAGVTIKNVTATNSTTSGILINGVPGYPVESLLLENIQIEVPGGGTAEDATVQLPENEGGYPENRMFGKTLPAYGIYARHVRDAAFKNIKVKTLQPDARPEKVFINVETAEPAPASVPSKL